MISLFFNLGLLVAGLICGRDYAFKFNNDLIELTLDGLNSFSFYLLY